MLSVSDLRCSYGVAEVLEGVSIEVPVGRVVAILGRNGMGKTTLCRCVMGLSPPRVTAGSVRYGETVITRSPSYEIARLGLGYVPQGRRVFPSLDVIENLTVSARPSADGEGWDLEKVWGIFPRLAERKHHGGGQLSGGEQQMLSIARALMTNPGLLVMDEPSEGLAPVVVESLADRLRELKGPDMSILLVEQNFTLAMELADVVYVMENGQIVFRGTPAELDASEEVKRRHLGVGV
jgi:branched-chain amino acid transport system ATP-binding protein